MVFTLKTMCRTFIKDCCWAAKRMRSGTGQREKLNCNAVLCWRPGELWRWHYLSEFSGVGMHCCKCGLTLEGGITLTGAAFLTKAILKEGWWLKIIFCQPAQQLGTSPSLLRRLQTGPGPSWRVSPAHFPCLFPSSALELPGFTTSGSTERKT